MSFRLKWWWQIWRLSWDSFQILKIMNSRGDNYVNKLKWQTLYILFLTQHKHIIFTQIIEFSIITKHHGEFITSQKKKNCISLFHFLRTDRWKSQIKKSVSGFITFQFEVEQKIHQIPPLFDSSNRKKQERKEKKKKNRTE